MNLIPQLKFALVLIVGLHCTSSLARGNKPLKGRSFGLGIIAGEPNGGLSLKYWTSKKTAIDGALAWPSGHGVHFHADYLIHNFGVIKVAKGLFPIHYGIGGFLHDHNHNYDHRHDDGQYVGLRFPAGASYLLQNHPLEFFMELVASLRLAPSTSFGVGLGIGGRYYF